MNSNSNTQTRFQRCTEWACHVLELPPDADAAQARGRLLRLLEDAEFVPPAEWVDACDVLVRRASGDTQKVPPPSFLIDDEARLLEEIESFRGEILSLPAAERVKRFDELVKESQPIPRAAARAEQLRPALSARPDSVPEKDSDTRRLSECVVELFGLSPRERSVRRRRLLTRLADDIERWETAAQWLQVRHPELAALDPPLLDGLAQMKLDRDRVPINAIQASYRPTAAPATRPADYHTYLENLRLVVVVVSLLVAVVGIWGAIIRHRPPRPALPPPNLRLPPRPYPQGFDREDLVFPPDRPQEFSAKWDEMDEESKAEYMRALGIEKEWRQAIERLREEGTADGASPQKSDNDSNEGQSQAPPGTSPPIEGP
jgi:hypothetical protein